MPDTDVNVTTEPEAGIEDQPLTLPDEEPGAETAASSTDDQAEKAGEAPDEGEPAEEADEPEIRQKYAELERNYQRLERKFTKVSQQLADAQEAKATIDFIASRPELAEQVNQLLQAYGDVPPTYNEGPAFDPQAEREAMRDLLSRPDFAKHEEEIAEFAEENGMPFESAVDQRTAYLMWRGLNADRLVQEARLEAAKKAAKLQQAKAKAGLQRAGGPGKPPSPDYKKMSDEEVLASLGLSLFTDD
ncbi:MAG: hypothetical protein AB1327_08110 [Bacillota bacterium]